jgi:hypothetical protein
VTPFQTTELELLKEEPGNLKFNKYFLDTKFLGIKFLIPVPPMQDSHFADESLQRGGMTCPMSHS